MIPLIVNIPHAGLEIPGDIPFLLDGDELFSVVRHMADLYTDEWIDASETIYPVVAKTARIVVDTERFVDDALETAAQYGQGVIYERDYKGRLLRHKPSQPERELLLEKYYHPHHQQLNQHCAESLRRYGRAMILDLHSYPASYNMGSGQGEETPDVCIGFDTPHYSESTLANLAATIKQLGFTCSLNAPFAGSLVPSDFFGNPLVHSYMLEIKRSLYMNEATFERNTEGMERVKLLLHNVVQLLQTH